MFQRNLKIAAAISLAATLAACGGGRLATPGGGSGGFGGAAPSTANVPFASGPISAACGRSGRKDANRQLCGCVQAAANETLSRSDQSLAVSFYTNPQRGQDVRQSDRPSNEAFWMRYKLYIARAERYCAPLR